MDNFFTGWVLAWLISLVLFYSTYLNSDQSEIANEVLNAITECEKELPRNVTCDYTITAKEKTLDAHNK